MRGTHETSIQNTEHRGLHQESPIVMDAIDEKYNTMTDFELVDELARLAKVEVPPAIKEIRTAPVVHDTVCGKDEMKQTVEKILGL